MRVKVLIAQQCPTLQLHGLQPGMLLCPWGLYRQEYQSGLPCPLPGDLPDPGIEPGSPALQADSLPPEPLTNSPSQILMSFQTLRIFFHSESLKCFFFSTYILNVKISLFNHFMRQNYSIEKYRLQLLYICIYTRQWVFLKHILIIS